MLKLGFSISLWLAYASISQAADPDYNNIAYLRYNQTLTTHHAIVTTKLEQHANLTFQKTQITEALEGVKSTKTFLEQQREILDLAKKQAIIISNDSPTPDQHQISMELLKSYLQEVETNVKEFIPFKTYPYKDIPLLNCAAAPFEYPIRELSSPHHAASQTVMTVTFPSLSFLQYSFILPLPDGMTRVQEKEIKNRITQTLDNLSERIKHLSTQSYILESANHKNSIEIVALTSDINCRLNLQAGYFNELQKML